MHLDLEVHRDKNKHMQYVNATHNDIRGRYSGEGIIVIICTTSMCGKTEG